MNHGEHEEPELATVEPRKNTEHDAPLNLCENEGTESETVEPDKNPEHDAALNSCEDELYVRGRLTALAKLYVRDENLQ